MNIRDKLADLGMKLCRRADDATAQGKNHAFSGLDGDENELVKAREARAKSEAFMEAMKMVDALRVEIDREKRGV